MMKRKSSHVDSGDEQQQQHVEGEEHDQQSAIPADNSAVHIRSDEPIWIYVKQLSGKVTPVQVSPHELVDDMKLLIMDSTGIPPEQMQPIFGGQQMQDGRVLSYYNVHNEATIQLVLKLRGNGDLISNHVLSTTPKHRTRNVQPGIVVIGVRFDERTKVRAASSGHVEPGTIIVKYGPIVQSGPELYPTAVGGIAGYDPAMHSMTFIPTDPIPPNCRVHVSLCEEKCFRTPRSNLSDYGGGHSFSTLAKNLDSYCCTCCTGHWHATLLCRASL